MALNPWLIWQNGTDPHCDCNFLPKSETCQIRYIVYLIRATDLSKKLLRKCENIKLIRRMKKIDAQ